MKPHLLPPNIQLFIPSEYRENESKTSRITSNLMLSNKNTSTNNTRTNQYGCSSQTPFNINLRKWPILSEQQQNEGEDKATCNQSIWLQLEENKTVIENLKQNINTKLKSYQEKVNDNVTKLKSILSTFVEQIKHQGECAERCYSTLNEIIPLLSVTLDVFQKIIMKCNSQTLTDNNNDEYKSTLNQVFEAVKLMQERNNILQSEQQAIEKQGQLLVQAIDSLSVDNE